MSEGWYYPNLSGVERVMVTFDGVSKDYNDAQLKGQQNWVRQLGDKLALRERLGKKALKRREAALKQSGS
jgi:hypothetical protein